MKVLAIMLCDLYRCQHDNVIVRWNNNYSERSDWYMFVSYYLQLENQTCHRSLLTASVRPGAKTVWYVGHWLAAAAPILLISANLFGMLRLPIFLMKQGWFCTPAWTHHVCWISPDRLRSCQPKKGKNTVTSRMMYLRLCSRGLWWQDSFIAFSGRKNTAGSTGGDALTISGIGTCEGKSLESALSWRTSAFASPLCTWCGDIVMLETYWTDLNLWCARFRYYTEHPSNYFCKQKDRRKMNDAAKRYKSALY